MPAQNSDFSRPPGPVRGDTAQEDLSLVEELFGIGLVRPITT